MNKALSPLPIVHGKGLQFGIHIMRGIPRRAVGANLPIFGTDFKAADVANKRSLCGWNTDMYGVNTAAPGGQPTTIPS